MIDFDVDIQGGRNQSGWKWNLRKRIFIRANPQS